MGDDKDGAVTHQSVHAFGDQLLRPGVDGGGGLVQHHDGRIGHGGSGNGEQLSLALGQVGAVSRHHGLIPVGEAADKAVGVGSLGCPDTVLIGGVQLAVADIVHNGAGKEVGVL